MEIIGNLAKAVDLQLFRNTLAPRAALITAEIALGDGRGHRQGQPTPIYGSENRSTADAEFLYHHPYFSGSTIRSTEIVGRLLVVDVTQEAVALALGVRIEDLGRDGDWLPCQRLTSEIFAQGAQALRLPSARHAGGTNLIVERSAGMTCLSEGEIAYRVIENK